jgi:mono/diheme cytochrome c family protein
MRFLVCLCLMTACASAAANDAAIARGKYIAESIAQCYWCHTPLRSDGQRDPERWLMGSPVQIEPTYSDPNWAIFAPKIAGGPAGTDEDFVREMTTGMSRLGRPLRRPMPQFRMTREDALAVLAYLKSLKH